MWGEEAKPIKHKIMLRGSLTSDNNEIGVAGRYVGAHTLHMIGGDERFHTKAVLKGQD